MEHPDEVDTQKLADISVQMLSSVGSVKYFSQIGLQPKVVRS